jgi:hypothetical protein
MTEGLHPQWRVETTQLILNLNPAAKKRKCTRLVGHAIF